VALPISSRWTRAGVVTVVTLGLAAVVAAAAAAQNGASPSQAPPGDNTYLNGVRDAYAAAAQGWRIKLIPIAQRTFMLLAALEFSVSGIVWAIKRETLDDLAAKFLLKFTLIAFLLTLITSFDLWLPPIFNGFVSAGEQVMGGGIVSPNEIVARGSYYAWQLMRATLATALTSNPIVGLMYVLCAVFIGGSFVVVACELLAVMVEAYVVVFGGGVLFLGFAASRWTAAYAEHLVSHAVYLGARAFFVYLIAIVGLDVINQLKSALTLQGILSPSGAMLQFVATTVCFAYLAVRIPRDVAWKLTGHASFGLANALRELS
jgi:P-type conjugative transfer protein TrbL